MDKINELTGLYNEEAFYEEVESFLQNADEKTYCMMAIDVEHFRLYNQLKQEAEALKHLYKKENEIIRYIDLFMEK